MEREDDTIDEILRGPDVEQSDNERENGDQDEECDSDDLAESILYGIPHGTYRVDPLHVVRCSPSSVQSEPNSTRTLGFGLTLVIYSTPYVGRGCPVNYGAGPRCSPA